MGTMRFFFFFYVYVKSLLEYFYFMDAKMLPTLVYKIIS